MKKIIFYIVLLSSLSSFGQEVIGRIERNVILEQKIISCTEWHNKEKGRTVYFNFQGLPHYFQFPAEVLDSSNNIISGDYGKKEFIYDENGNLSESIMLCYEPRLDSTVVLTLIKNYYKDNLIIKREYFDNPNSKPTIRRYFYNDTLLIKEVKTRPDTSLIVSTGGKFKVESKEYKYDDSNRLASILSFREAQLLDSTSISYHNDTTTWITFDNFNEEKSIVKTIYDQYQREIERIYPEEQIIKWNYNKNGLLNSIEYHYLKSGVTRTTEFKYEHK